MYPADCSWLRRVGFSVSKSVNTMAIISGILSAGQLISGLFISNGTAKSDDLSRLSSKRGREWEGRREEGGEVDTRGAGRMRGSSVK